VAAVLAVSAASLSLPAIAEDNELLDSLDRRRAGRPGIRA
jgi:hypothetical protein